MKERDKCRIGLFFLPEREKSGGGGGESGRVRYCTRLSFEIDKAT